MQPIVVKILGEVSGLMNDIRKSKQSIKDFGKEVEKSAEKRQALNDLGSTFTRVGLLAVAGSALAIKAAMDWEQAWTGVLKTVDGTPAQLAAVEEGLRSLAKSSGVAHEEVAAVAAAAGQLGISTGGITAFTEQMLAMGVSTNLSSEEAATGMARFRNIMGTSEGDISRIGSTIVDLGNNFATTEREILDMSMRLAGAGRQAGITEAGVLGISAAMSSVGIEAEAGGTAMSMTMKRIGKEVDTQGTNLETFATVAGMSAADFSTAWKDDAAGALTEFIAGLDRVEQSGGSVNQVLSTLGVTGIREADALLRLSSNSEGLADAIDLSSDAWKQNIALMAEADKFYGTTQSKVKQAWAEIKDAAISAGDTILPVVAAMASAVGNVAEVFAGLPAPVKGGLTALAGVGGTALLAMAGLIKLHGAISSTRESLDTLAISGGKSGKAIAGMGKAAVVLAAVWAAVEVGEQISKRSGKEVSGLGKELAELGKSGKVGKDLEETFGKGLGGKSQRFRSDIKSIGEAIQQFDKVGNDNFVTKFTNDIRTMPTRQGEGFYDAANGIRDMDAAFAQLSRNKPEDAVKAFEKIRDAALDQGASIEDLERAFPSMTEVLRNASSAMGGTSDTAELLAGDLTDLGPAAQAAAEALAEQKQATQDAAMGFADFSAGIDDAKLSLKDWIKGLAEMAQAQDAWADNTIKAMGRGVSEGVITEFEKAGPAGAKMLDDLVNGSQKNIDKLNDIFGGFGDTASDLSFIRKELGEDVVMEFNVQGDKDAIGKATAVANRLGLTPPVVETILRALDFTKPQIAAVLAALGNVDGKEAKVKVTAINDASGVIAGIRREITNLDGTTATVYSRMVRKGMTGGGTTEADGGVLDFYANGGMRENHVAQIAPAGSWRVWAEDETGGESYIPLGKSKRKRSLEIFAETGKRLGVPGYADGAVVGGAAGTGGGYSASLVGARIAIDKNGLASFVDGRIDVVQSGNDNYRASKSRAGSK